MMLFQIMGPQSCVEMSQNVFQTIICDVSLGPQESRFQLSRRVRIVNC